MTKEEAAADCWAITSKIGERFARSIMGKTIAMELEPDEMDFGRRFSMLAAIRTTPKSRRSMCISPW